MMFQPQAIGCVQRLEYAWDDANIIPAPVPLASLFRSPPPGLEVGRSMPFEGVSSVPVRTEVIGMWEYVVSSSLGKQVCTSTSRTLLNPVEHQSVPGRSWERLSCQLRTCEVQHWYRQHRSGGSSPGWHGWPFQQQSHPVWASSDQRKDSRDPSRLLRSWITGAV